MKKTVILHIGQSKAGSTAIQRFCWDNRRRLSGPGQRLIWYLIKRLICGRATRITQLLAHIPVSLMKSEDYRLLEALPDCSSNAFDCAHGFT